MNHPADSGIKLESHIGTIEANPMESIKIKFLRFSKASKEIEAALGDIGREFVTQSPSGAFMKDLWFQDQENLKRKMRSYHMIFERLKERFQTEEQLSPCDTTSVNVILKCFNDEVTDRALELLKINKAFVPRSFKKINDNAIKRISKAKDGLDSSNDSYPSL